MVSCFSSLPFFFFLLLDGIFSWDKCVYGEIDKWKVLNLTFAKKVTQFEEACFFGETLVFGQIWMLFC